MPVSDELELSLVILLCDCSNDFSASKQLVVTTSVVLP